MTKQALAQVVQRAISDAAFRRQLSSDPAGALRGFDLSADEASAIRTGDAGRLSTLGVDQRMSKAFAIGGAAASTRMAASDLTSGGGPSAVDDLSGAGGRTVIPADPTRPGGSDDIDGGGTSGTSTARAGDDYKFAGRVAPEGGATARTGDDWKYADHAAAAQRGAVAPVEGSPEATAADIAGGTRASAINDDPDGFLAANAKADSGGVVRAINDDPDGFLAANANATTSGTTSAGDGTAFLDDSEAYLTKVGYDSSMRQTAVTDAHDRTWSGDDIAGPSSVDAGTEGGTDTTPDGNEITP